MSELIKAVKRYVSKNDNGWSMEFAMHLAEPNDMLDRLEYLEEVIGKINKRLSPPENWEAEIETVLNVKGVARGERVFALEKRIQAWSDEVSARLAKLEKMVQPGADVEGLFSKRVFDLEQRIQEVVRRCDVGDDSLEEDIGTLAKASKELDRFVTESRKRIEDLEESSRSTITKLRALEAAFRDLDRRDQFPASPSYNPFPEVARPRLPPFMFGGQKPL